MATVTGAMVGAEGGDFDLYFVEEHLDHTELRADGDGLGKELEHLLGSGAGGNVVVEWVAAQQHVTDAATSPVGLVAGVDQTANDVNRFLAQLAHSRNYTAASERTNE